MADEQVGSAWWEADLDTDKLRAAVANVDRTFEQSGRASAQAFATPFERATGQVRGNVGEMVSSFNELRGRGPEVLTDQLERAVVQADDARDAIRRLVDAGDMDPADARRYADALDEIGIEADQSLADLRELANSDPRFDTPALRAAAVELDRVGQEARRGATELNALKGVHADTHLERLGQEARETAGDLDRANRSAGGLGDKLNSVKGIIAGLGVAIGAQQILSFFGSAIDMASDLAETQSKVRVVFEEHAEAIFELGETSAESLGMSENAALSAAGTYGNLFRAMDITTETSAEMSAGLVTLAADLASFNNMDPTEVLDKLRAGLSGETEPLRSLGVNLNAARIEAEAMKLGLADANGELDAAAKAQATYALILQDTTLAQGDFARTAAGTANLGRSAAAKWQDAMTELGAKLEPMMNRLLRFSSDVLPLVGEAIEGVIDVTGVLGGTFQRHADIIVPALAIAVGVKLVGALRDADLASNTLATTLSRNPWVMAIAGFMALGEAHEFANERLQELADTEADRDFAAGRIPQLEQMGLYGDEVGEVAGATEDLTKKTEELADGTGSLADAVATGHVEIRRQVNDSSAAVDEWARRQAEAAESAGRSLTPLEEAWRVSVARLLATAQEGPDGLSVILDNGTEVIGTDAAELADKLPNALEAGKQESLRIMQETMSGMVDIMSAEEFQRLVDEQTASIENQWSDSARMMAYYAFLGSEGVRAGLASTDRDVRNDTVNRVNAVLEELGVLVPAGTTIAENMPAEMRAGWQENELLLTSALQNTARQAGLDLDFTEAARAQGLAGILKYAEGEDAAKHEASAAAARAAYAAFLATDNRAMMREGGYNSGAAWANGLRDAKDYAALMAWELAASVNPALHGLSPPREGPLSDIDEGAANVARAWGDAWPAQGGYIRRQVEAALFGAEDALSAGRAASFGVDIATGPRLNDALASAATAVAGGTGIGGPGAAAPASSPALNINVEFNTLTLPSAFERRRVVRELVGEIRTQLNGGL